MRYLWLILVACLFVVACDKSEPMSRPVTKPSADSAQPIAANQSINKADDTGNKASEIAESTNETAAPTSGAEKFAQLTEQYSNAMKEFYVLAREAKPADRQKLMAEKTPRVEDYAKQVMQLATDNPEEPFAVEALSWVATNVRNGKLADQAFDILLSKHIEHEKIQELVMSMGRSISLVSANRLNLVIEKSSHPTVQAAARYSLAQLLQRLPAALKSQPKMDKKGLGDEVVAWVDSEDATNEKMESLYQSLVDDYSDLQVSPRSDRTYGDIAKSSLFELQHLAIGKIAPDIEGEDFDGTKFKLSEYRGKVVVIDFWGDW